MLQAIPLVVRSREALLAEQGKRTSDSLPIRPSGATYSMAQSVAWLDDDHFAIGRWDGTLSIFEFSRDVRVGPVIASSVSSPAYEGVQMIVRLAGDRFATSNDDRSIAVWRPLGDDWASVAVEARLDYDQAYGVANCAGYDPLRNLLVVGHSGGYLTCWSMDLDHGRADLLRVLDLRIARPVNPWGLQNIRGVQVCHAADSGRPFAVTGSENGELCLIDLQEGEVVFRRLFSESARRGINAIAVDRSLLLVANCSVGPEDRNLWLFELSLDVPLIAPLQSANLRIDPQDPQVFNFCVVWGHIDDGPCFFASTEEGALWVGRVGPDRSLELLGHKVFTPNLGAALAFHEGGRLALVGHDLYEFETVAIPASPQAPASSAARRSTRAGSPSGMAARSFLV